MTRSTRRSRPPSAAAAFRLKLANRNRHPDTDALMAAIARIEAALGSDAPAKQSTRLPDISAAAERLADIAFGLRGRGADGTLCDALDAAVREICAACGSDAETHETGNSVTLIGRSEAASAGCGRCHCGFVVARTLRLGAAGQRKVRRSGCCASRVTGRAWRGSPDGKGTGRHVVHDCGRSTAQLSSGLGTASGGGCETSARTGTSKGPTSCFISRNVEQMTVRPDPPANQPATAAASRSAAVAEPARGSGGIIRTIAGADCGSARFRGGDIRCKAGAHSAGIGSIGGRPGCSRGDQSAHAEPDRSHGAANAAAGAG